MFRKLVKRISLTAVLVTLAVLAVGRDVHAGLSVSGLDSGIAFQERDCGRTESEERFSYNLLGQLVGFKQTMAHPDGSRTVVERSGYEYNALGQLVGFSEVTTHPDGSRTLDVASFEYNALGQLVGFNETTAHPDGSRTVVERSGYEYNALGQLTGATGTTVKADGSRIEHGEAWQQDAAGRIILHTVTVLTPCP